MHDSHARSALQPSKNALQPPKHAHARHQVRRVEAGICPPAGFIQGLVLEGEPCSPAVLSHHKVKLFEGMGIQTCHPVMRKLYLQVNETKTCADALSSQVVSKVSSMCVVG
jgi:hypothetical protein